MNIELNTHEDKKQRVQCTQKLYLLPHKCCLGQSITFWIYIQHLRNKCCCIYKNREVNLSTALAQIIKNRNPQLHILYWSDYDGNCHMLSYSSSRWLFLISLKWYWKQRPDFEITSKWNWISFELMISYWSMVTEIMILTLGNSRRI